MFPVFKACQIKEIDSFTIKNRPISSIDLMEVAVSKFCEKLLCEQPSGKFLIFAGPGNNGGDALGIARHLYQNGHCVRAYLYKCGHRLSSDCETNKQRLLEKCPQVLTVVDDEFSLPEVAADDIIIDGLFGNGLNRPLQNQFADVVKFINSTNNTVFAIDIPSGLMAENNGENIKEHVIHADYTFTFQYPKLAFLFPDNQKCVGKWSVLDIGLLKPDNVLTNVFLLDKTDVATFLRKKSVFAHKGTEGHALLLAGQVGMAGAAMLAAKACLRTGVGKVTVATQEPNRIIMQLGVPEAILHIGDVKDNAVALQRYQAVGVGPGIGTSLNMAEQLEYLLNNYRKPMVIDADAINILSVRRELMQKLPELSILTPHKLELRRLIDETDNDYDELLRSKSFAREHNVIIVLKGAFTKIIMPDGTIFVNPTGNPGMATAGSGDVLTGIITAFLAQGYEPKKAALLGVYIHGLAGDKAACCLGQHALIASDIIQFLPEAFKTLG